MGGNRAQRGARVGGDMEFDLVRRLGVPVVEVPGMKRKVCFVEDVEVGMIREGLDHEDRIEAAWWLFAEATRHRHRGKSVAS